MPRAKRPIERECGLTTIQRRQVRRLRTQQVEYVIRSWVYREVGRKAWHRGGKAAKEYLNLRADEMEAQVTLLGMQERDRFGTVPASNGKAVRA